MNLMGISFAPRLVIQALNLVVAIVLSAPGGLERSSAPVRRMSDRRRRPARR